MHQITVDRRVSSRRSGRSGGRRASDQQISSTVTPVCPCCGQRDTVLAGEGEGGWWFVCDSCDHLWDQRLVRSTASPEIQAIAIDRRVRPEPRTSSWLSSAALSWWKMASGRTS